MSTLSVMILDFLCLACIVSTYRECDTFINTSNLN